MAERKNEREGQRYTKTLFLFLFLLTIHIYQSYIIKFLINKIDMNLIEEGCSDNHRYNSYIFEHSLRKFQYNKYKSKLG